MKIKVVKKRKHRLTQYTFEAYAGVHLRGNPASCSLSKSRKRSVEPTGILMEIPVGFETQMRTENDLSIKNGITILNSPGSIYADYRRDVCIIMMNLSTEKLVIKESEMMDIAKHEKVERENFLNNERRAVRFRNREKFNYEIT